MYRKKIGIVLVVDLVKYLPNNYPHDKSEGIWLINRNTIGIINDDNFAITAENEEIAQKFLPGTNQIDRNILYFITLK